MPTELTLAPWHTLHPSRSVIAIAGLVVAGICVASFFYGRSAFEAVERSNALAVASENQTFCTGLGLAPQSESYRKCLAGLDEIRFRQERRWQTDAAGLL